MDTAGQDITVRFFASMKDLFERRQAQVSRDQAPTVGRLLKHLCSSPQIEQEIFTGAGALRPEVIVLVNGRSIAFLGGLEASLQAEDEVAIFPPLKGG